MKLTKRMGKSALLEEVDAAIYQFTDQYMHIASLTPTCVNYSDYNRKIYRCAVLDLQLLLK